MEVKWCTLKSIFQVCQVPHDLLNTIRTTYGMCIRKMHLFLGEGDRRSLIWYALKNEIYLQAHVVSHVLLQTIRTTYGTAYVNAHAFGRGR